MDRKTLFSRLTESSTGLSEKAKIDMPSLMARAKKHVGKVYVAKTGRRRYVCTFCHVFGIGGEYEAAGTFSYSLVALSGGDRGSHATGQGDSEMGTYWKLAPVQTVEFSGKRANKLKGLYANDVRQKGSGHAGGGGYAYLGGAQMGMTSNPPIVEAGSTDPDDEGYDGLNEATQVFARSKGAVGSDLVRYLNENIGAAQAEKIGRAAFAAGKKRVPMHDADIMKHLKGLPIGGGSSAILGAWLKGWDKANLAAPVESHVSKGQKVTGTVSKVAPDKEDPSSEEYGVKDVKKVDEGGVPGIGHVSEALPLGPADKKQLMTFFKEMGYDAMGKEFIDEPDKRKKIALHMGRVAGGKIGATKGHRMVQLLMKFAESTEVEEAKNPHLRPFRPNDVKAMSRARPGAIRAQGGMAQLDVTSSGAEYEVKINSGEHKGDSSKGTADKVAAWLNSKFGIGESIEEAVSVSQAKAAFKKAGATLSVLKVDKAGGDFGDYDFYTSPPMEGGNLDNIGKAAGKTLGMNYIRVTDHQGGLKWYFQSKGMKEDKEKLMEPGFVKTPADEKKWNRAKELARKQNPDNMYALANHIFQNMKEAEGVNEPPGLPPREYWDYVGKHPSGQEPKQDKIPDHPDAGKGRARQPGAKVKGKEYSGLVKKAQQGATAKNLGKEFPALKGKSHQQQQDIIKKTLAKGKSGEHGGKKELPHSHPARKLQRLKGRKAGQVKRASRLQRSAHKNSPEYKSKVKNLGKAAADAWAKNVKDAASKERSKKVRSETMQHQEASLKRDNPATYTDGAWGPDGWLDKAKRHFEAALKRENPATYNDFDKDTPPGWLKEFKESLGEAGGTQEWRFMSSDSGGFTVYHQGKGVGRISKDGGKWYAWPPYSGHKQVGPFKDRMTAAKALTTKQEYTTTEYPKAKVESTEPEVIEGLRQIFSERQGGEIAGQTIDPFTAGRILQVYDSVNQELREQFASHTVGQMASMAFDLSKSSV